MIRRSVGGWSIVAASLFVVIAGCGYSEIAAPAYELADMLYRVCDRRSNAQMDKFTELLNQRHAAGAVSDKEHQVLLDIVEVAKRGDWSAAKGMVRELMQAQNRESPRSDATTTNGPPFGEPFVLS